MCIHLGFNMRILCVYEVNILCERLSFRYQGVLEHQWVCPRVGIIDFQAPIYECDGTGQVLSKLALNLIKITIDTSLLVLQAPFTYCHLFYQSTYITLHTVYLNTYTSPYNQYPHHAFPYNGA